MAEKVMVRPDARVGPAYVLETVPLTPFDVAEIRVNPSLSLYKIPFGPARGKITIRRLVELFWKGKRGAEFRKACEKKGYRGLLAANELIRKISKAYAGIKGVVFKEGTYYPKKAIAQKAWKEEKPDLAKEYTDKVVPEKGKGVVVKVPVAYVILSPPA